MKPNTLYIIIWQTPDGERQGGYTWDGKGIETSKDQYIILTRDADGSKTKPVSVSSLKGNIYSAKMSDLDLSSINVK